MILESPRIAFVRASWHADIVDCAFKGFQIEALRLMPSARIDSYVVPGAFEMPLLAKKIALRKNYDAVVAAALVVDGGIYRHEFVAQAVVWGLMQVALETGVPCFSVSLTPHNYQETEVLIDFYRKHFAIKGAEAAQAVAQMEIVAAQLVSEDQVNIA